MPSTRGARILLPTLGLLLLGALLLVASGRAPESGDAGSEALLRARSAALRSEMDLSLRGRRYLVLDPPSGTLTLYLGPTPLRSYPVLTVEAGERRLPIGRGHPRSDWRSALWEDPRLEPPIHRVRGVIVSDSVEPPDPTGAVDWIPPTPDEAVPTPARFVVHFSGGLGVEVVAEGDDSTGVRSSAWARAVHRARALLPGNWDRYRIRVVMPAADAGALYRSLPDSTALVAIIPR